MPSLLLVVGPGRSGTSLFATLGRHLGYHIPQPEVRANRTNPKGFAEPQWVVDFHTDLLRQARVLTSDARPQAWQDARAAVTDRSRTSLARWLDKQAATDADLLVKDPRSLWFLDLWSDAAASIGLPIHYVTVLRHPAAVVASRTSAYGQGNPSAGKAAVWLNTALGTEAATRGAARAFIRYEDLMSDWEPAVSRMTSQIGRGSVLDLPAFQRNAINEFVDPSLRRSADSWDGLDVPASPRQLADETWAAVQGLVDDPDSIEVQRTLDGLAERYRTMYAEAESLAASTTLIELNGPHLGRTPVRPPRRSAPDASSTAAKATLQRIYRALPSRLRSAIPVSLKRSVRRMYRHVPAMLDRRRRSQVSSKSDVRYTNAVASWHRRRDAVANACSATGIRTVPLYPDRLGWSVAVDVSQRQQFLQAMADGLADDLLLQARDGASNPSHPVAVGKASDSRALRRTPAVDVLLADEVDLGPRMSYTCSVEFWDALPGPAATMAHVPPTTGLDFPVDAVFLWVDDNDPEWRRQRNEYLLELGQGGDETATSRARFESRDELRYALRSVHYYAPWFRRIFLVTAGQRPDWLVETEELVLVDHAAIFDDRALPTFNSNAIISQLHHIPGLAEHYVLFNDDVFLGRPTPPERFFASSGAARFFLSESRIPYESAEAETPLHHAQMATRSRLMQNYGIRPSCKPAHTPHPQRRSLHEEFEAEHPDWYDTTANNRFRDPSDLEPLTLHSHAGLATRRTALGDLDYVSVVCGYPGFDLELQRIYASPGAFDSFCLNDTVDGKGDREEVTSLMSRFLARRFPDKAPWER